MVISSMIIYGILNGKGNEVVLGRTSQDKEQKKLFRNAISVISSELKNISWGIIVFGCPLYKKNLGLFRLLKRFNCA